jgi:hypothetical protein
MSWCAATGETKSTQYAGQEPIAFGVEQEELCTDYMSAAPVAGLEDQNRDRLAYQRPVCFNGAICQLIAMFGELVGRTNRKLRLARYATNAAAFFAEWLEDGHAKWSKDDAAFADWLIRRLLAEPIVRLDTVCWWTLVLMADEFRACLPSPVTQANVQMEPVAVHRQEKSFANLFGWRLPAPGRPASGWSALVVPWEGIRRFEEAMPTGLARRLSGHSAIGDWCLETAPFPGSSDPNRPFLKAARAF